MCHIALGLLFAARAVWILLLPLAENAPCIRRVAREGHAWIYPVTCRRKNFDSVRPDVGSNISFVNSSPRHLNRRKWNVQLYVNMSCHSCDLCEKFKKKKLWTPIVNSWLRACPVLFAATWRYSGVAIRLIWRVSRSLQYRHDAPAGCCCCCCRSSNSRVQQQEAP